MGLGAFPEVSLAEARQRALEQRKAVGRGLDPIEERRARRARWKNNLRHQLPARSKVQKVRHHAALPYVRIGAFVADLRQREGMSPRALEFAILTAARSGEVRGATWREINLKTRRWTIPASRMKREKEHVVPLSPAAVKLLKGLPRIGKSDVVFPAPRGGELSDAAMGAIIDSLHEADRKRGGSGYLDPSCDKVATPHGFRSSFRDWAAEVAYFPCEVIEHALAHKLKDKAEAAYQRGTLLEKRAKLMEEWRKYCGVRRDTSGKVIPLKRRKAG